MIDYYYIMTDNINEFKPQFNVVLKCGRLPTPMRETRAERNVRLDKEIDDHLTWYDGRNGVPPMRPELNERVIEVREAEARGEISLTHAKNMLRAAEQAQRDSQRRIVEAKELIRLAMARDAELH